MHCRNWRNIFDMQIVESYGKGQRSPPGHESSQGGRETGGRRKQALVAHFFVSLNPPKNRPRDHNKNVRRARHTLTASTPSTAKTDAKRNCATAKGEPESVDSIENSGE